MGEYRRAYDLHQEILALAVEAGDQGGIARAWGDLGIDAISSNNIEEAKRRFQQSLLIYKEMGDGEEIADALGDLAEAANE